MSEVTQSLPEAQNEEMTFGMKLVGINFNPSGDPKVNKAKQLCAQLADLLYAEDRNVPSEIYNRLWDHALGEILNAQMNVVKVLTLKY